MPARKEDGESVGQGTIRRVTDKATLVDLEDIGRSVWIPNSQFGENSEIYEGMGPGEEGVVYVRKWFAEQEGLL